MLTVFLTMSASVFLEGLFFLILGSIVSACIEVFVSEEFLRKIIPAGSFFAVFAAALVGLVFPVCECGIVPVVHRLLRKKVPLHVCITMLFASPIVNILVIVSTAFAFYDYTYIIFFRMLGGFVIAVLTGLTVRFSFKTAEVLVPGAESEATCCCTGHDHTCDAHAHDSKTGHGSRFGAVAGHALEDFFETGKYFIIGIFASSLIQVLIPGRELSSFGATFPGSSLFMIAFPFVLSNCSNTDAFIARSLFSQFSSPAILVFLVFGPMFDIKTFIMLKKVFRLSFIIRLLLLIIVFNLAYSLVMQLILGGS
jgi:uncharacterized protein